MNNITRRRGRAVSGALVAALAFGGTLVGLPGSGSPPVAEAAGLEVIALEAPNDNLVILGSLASRSQQKPVTIAGIGPYTVTGTDSTTSEPYSFVTDYNYAPSTPAHANESDERQDSGMSFFSNPAASFDSRTGVLSLTSSGGCTGGDTGSGGNRPNGIASYCSVFGPEVYSEPFNATVGQSVSFDWAAQGGGDDYEAYAYLVEVTETSPGVFDYGDPASHVVLDYGRGTRQGWLTASGPVPSDGSYRFRFVNGTYDKTGGLAIGANMYIDSVVRLGTSNPITFAPLGDRVIGSGDVTLSATSASPGDPVSFSTTTSPSVCTLSGTTVTIVGVGVCAISADHPGDGVTYVPASTVTQSFTILAAATAPTNSGVPLIQGQGTPPAAGDIVTATEGTWGDGGSTITGTTAGFESNGAPIAGVSGSSCVLVADAGSTLTYTVTKTNAVGSTEATSASIVGFTCSAAVAPAWTDDVLGTLRVDEVFNGGVTASGTPAVTYSVSAGSLPAGLALNPSTGAITGTPTTAGAYSFTIEADNGVGSGITTVFSGTVATAAVAPSITYAGPTGLVVGAAIAAALPVVTADPAATFSVTAGVLPAGLSLNPATGAITGTPTAAGAYSFTVTATNSAGTDVAVFSGTVAAVPAFSDEVIGDLVVGEVFADGVAASGTPAATFSVTAGVLPAGLALDSATGAITGTPTTAGAYSFTVTATNSAGTDVAVFFGTVAAAPSTEPPVVVVQPPSSEPGAPVVITGGGFVPGSTVDVVIDGVVVESALVDSDGNISVEVDQPDNGDYSIEFRTSGGGETLASQRVIAGFDGVTYVVPENSGYVALTPDRVLDTRDAGTKLEAGDTYRLQVGSDWGVPESAHTVALNVTATEAEDVGYLTVFPCGQDLPPLASVVNYVAGTDTPNLSLVAPGENEEICIFSLRSTHLVVDLNGYFADGVDAQLTPQKHVRLVDTRSGTKVSGGDVLEVQVTGEGFAPESATAAVLNVAATNASGIGYLTLFPCNEDRPLASNVNYEPGSTNAGQAYVKLSPTGTVCVYSLQDVDVVMDLNASFSSADAALLVSMTSTRVLDTRDGAPVAAGGVVELQLGGDEGVRDALAFALNVTATESTGEGFLTVYACEDDRPLASSVNLAPGKSVSNHSTAIAGSDGKVCVYTSTATHLVVDVEGVYL